MSPQELSYWFDTEVKPHEGELRGYLYHRTDELADIDDIVQESYKRIVEVKRAKPIPSPRGLLFAIAKNLQRDLFRRKSVSNTALVEDMDYMHAVDDRENSPHELLSKSDDLEALKAAIRSLPPKCREVLILRKLENRSQQEIADRLKISINTVETHLGRALDKCQKYFERHGHTQGRKGKNGST